MPDGFHFVWSDDVPPTEREPRDTTARTALRDAGLLGPGPDGPVEPHVRRFLDVLHRPTAVVAAQAWTREQHWIEVLACDAQWGTSLLRARRPPDDPTTAADPWVDEDAIVLSMAQTGPTLARPLDLFEQVRQPDERAMVTAPVVLTLAESVAAVAASRPDRDPEVARQLWQQVGADRSGEPFLSLAAGIDAGFEVTATAPHLPTQHALYLNAQGTWVSLASQTDPTALTASEKPSGPDLVDATTVRLATVTAGSIIADYLTTVAALQREADQ